MTDIDKDTMGRFLFRYHDGTLKEDIYNNNDMYKYLRNIRLKIINIIKKISMKI